MLALAGVVEGCCPHALVARLGSLGTDAEAEGIILADASARDNMALVAYR